MIAPPPPEHQHYAANGIRIAFTSLHIQNFSDSLLNSEHNFCCVQNLCLCHRSMHMPSPEGVFNKWKDHGWALGGPSCYSELLFCSVNVSSHFRGLGLTWYCHNQLIKSILWGSWELNRKKDPNMQCVHQRGHLKSFSGRSTSFQRGQTLLAVTTSYCLGQPNGH